MSDTNHSTRRVKLGSETLWHGVGDGAFGPPFGTIRVCRVCDCLVAGGPTACVRCVEEETRRERERAPRSLRRRLSDAWAGLVSGWLGKRGRS